MNTNDMSEKFKNWGPFFEEIVQMGEQSKEKRSNERDPYKQLIFDEELRTVKTIEYLYRNYLDKGLSEDLSSNAQGSMLGHGFLIELEKLQETLNGKAQIQKHKYMAAAYRMKIRLVKKVINQFKGFILKA